MNSDAVYSLLYQNKFMTELLLRSWSPPGVSALLDFATLQCESPKLYDDAGRLRVGDLIYSVQLKGGGQVWVVILLEFQSTSDPMMAWRVLSYASLFWRRVEEDGRLQDGKLPAVLPLVLYNGRRRWSAPLDLSGCIKLPADSALWATTPQASYVLVDIPRQDAAWLRELDNPVAWAMLLERPDALPEAEQLARKVEAWAQAPERRGIRKAFALLLWELAGAGRISAEGLNSKEMELTEEEENMPLNESFARWRDVWREEGLQEGESIGLQKGEKLGLNRGLRAAVEMGLELRFGELGRQFWRDHIAPQDIAPWDEMMGVIRSAKTLDELHKYRRQ